jgi:hypothetical protein
MTDNSDQIAGGKEEVAGDRWLPWSLHSAARRAKRRRRRKNRAASVGMTAGEQPKSTGKSACATRGREEYNCGHGQQTDCTDIAGDGFAFAD